jgi:uncharacterized protein (DUF2236 family)
MSEYAAATQIVERSAAAFVKAIPQQPGDGYFAPGSVTWRIAGDLSAPVAGLRALLLQALHPLAMAGVDQHSDWRRDPVGRYAATAAYLSTITYADRATADQAAARVRKIHEHVTGTDPVTGQHYAASDPDLLLWVHATFVESGLVAAELFGTPATDPDAYIREMRIAAELLGVPRDMIPADRAELGEYADSVLPRLRVTPAAGESSGYMLNPPGLDDELAELWQDIRAAVLIALPGWALDMYGFERPADSGEIRGTLGVLDAVLLGEPGMLEARQRITLRMRQP